MSRSAPLSLLLLLVLLRLPAAAVHAQDDDDGPRPSLQPDSSGAFALTPSQQQAVGIRVDHPQAMASAQSLDAYGLVLDPAALVNDAGHVDSTRAAAEAAAADVARIDGLYRNNGDASLKALQAAHASAAEATAQAQSAASSFRLQWGPIAALDAPARAAMIGALLSGQRLLLRADVPGHLLLSHVAPHALLSVDGVDIAAQVLGPMRRTDAQSQSAAWLLQVEHAPPGLGPGARALVRLQAAPVKGLLVPAAALLYGDHGAYVFRQVGNAGERTQYAAAPVTPLVRVGDGWLVSGLGGGDSVVVQGAGVLWSLEGISTFSAAEEEHD
jgi:hypothetical protein